LIVEQLTKEINTDNKKLEDLEISQKELEQLIESVQETLANIDFSQPLEGIKHLKGKLKWPTKGKHIQKYGSRLTGGLRSNGVIIKADEGSAVKAIHYGRVVYADWLRGFGLMLIIDHGKGYMSLYGYNQALYKQVGDWVEVDETIAIVGQSGGRKESALYFELRSKGKPFNPKRWFR
jgi:septal ring factor EnvC (AmiA/AmiB activator)